MSKTRLLYSGALLVSLLYSVLSSPTALASIAGNYPPGAFTGMRSAFSAPLGSVVVENGSLFFRTDEYVDDAGNSSDTVLVNAFVNRTALAYSFDRTFLDATYTIAGIVPFANAKLRAEPSDAKTSMQLGDMVLQPFGLTWQQKQWSYGIAYNLWLPTGRFTAGASNNVGKGLYSHMLTGNLGWSSGSKQPWLGSVQVKYEIMGTQSSTGINPGNNLIVEGGLGKQLSTSIDLGLSYYFLHQLTEERGSKDSNKTRLYGIGPELSWRPENIKGLQLSYRGYVDYAVRNSSKGFFNVISITYVFE